MSTVVVTEADSKTINTYENVTKVAFENHVVRIYYCRGSLHQSMTYPYERIIRIYEEFEA